MLMQPIPAEVPPRVKNSLVLLRAFCMSTKADATHADIVLKFSQPHAATGTAMSSVAKEDTGTQYFYHHSKSS